MAESGGTGPADSYIGSLISLTSKSEIRYEGLLYTVDTENSNIALQNVRSFGTEGRKKNGLQIPSSDKVYEFIIFRGSDIKDLQVKTPPPPSIHSDPAIISLQAQVSQPVTVLPHIAPATDVIGNQSTYKANQVPYYHTATSGVPLWAPPPPPQVPSASIPYYWQGFYRPQDDYRLLEPSSGVDSTTVSAGVLPAPLTSTAYFSSFSLGQDQALPQALTGSSHLPLGSLTGSAVEAIDSNQVNLETTFPVSNALPSSSSSNVNLSGILQGKSDVDVGSLKPDNTKVKPFIVGRSGGISGVSHSPITIPAAHSARKVPGKNHQVYKQVYRQVQVTKDNVNAGHRVPSSRSQPLLPLPISPAQRKPLLQIHEGFPKTNSMRRGGSRGGGMGRANRSVPLKPKLLEDFDFIAMNEKFKKEEVWDELLKVEFKDRVVDESSTGMDYGFQAKEIKTEIDGGVSELSKRSVYVKDDFFDSLSCDALGREHGKPERLKFSEQRRIDAETFGSCNLRMYRGGGASRRRRGGVGRGQTRGGSSNRGSHGHSGICG